MSGCVFGQRNVIGGLVNREMMPELLRMLSFNAILLRHWEFFVLWKQSGYAVSATLAVILFANRRSLCTMRQTFDLFPMSGRVVWMEFLKKCTAKVQALRVN